MEQKKTEDKNRIEKVNQRPSWTSKNINGWQTAVWESNGNKTFSLSKSYKTRQGEFKRATVRFFKEEAKDVQEVLQELHETHLRETRE